MLHSRGLDQSPVSGAAAHRCRGCVALDALNVYAAPKHLKEHVLKKMKGCTRCVLVDSSVSL